ncbi:hypothetical protein LCGC14_1542600 [marine sediment metagenome]|uniref:Uncharacterized protein n=1 Tax=marine sediment metagenome TaxID=412755 RepID=A0A0F9LTF8_9ZZZZ
MTKEGRLKEEYLKERGFTKAKGYAINTQEMNPNDCDEIFFEGNNLQKAIQDYVREVKEYWIYEPSDGEQLFEDIDEAIDYVEEVSDVSFDKFKKIRKAKQKRGSE